jgi:glutamate-1-semialdehyde 2,1-aminomutase
MLTSSYQPAANTTASRALWERARKVAPLGAQGDGKFYAPYPHYLSRASGSRVWDVDGNEYIDYWNGAGPCVLGHSDPFVDDAVSKTMRSRGTVYCAPHELEIELGEKLASIIPCAEMSAFLNAGSDILYMAARVARAATGRKLLVKFAGSYHGWYEDLLFNVSSYDKPADNRGLYQPIAESTGITDEARQSIRVLDYNDIAAVEELFRAEGDQIAAVVVEPIMHGPMTGNIEALPGFLEKLREVCTAYGAILIFDEILTGFRHNLGGAQALLGVTPDLAAFGKAIANGMPIAALCGRRDIMEQLAPAGRAFFSGTYNGNVASVSAALATIERLSDGEVFTHIWALGERMRAGIEASIAHHGFKAMVRNYGSVVALHRTDRKVNSFGDIWRRHDMSDAVDLASFLFENGTYTKPRRVQRLLISGAHTEDDIDRTVDVFDRYFAGK